MRGRGEGKGSFSSFVRWLMKWTDDLDDCIKTIKLVAANY